jgi:predicted Zn-dependent peptidase
MIKMMEFKKHILDNGLAVIGEVNKFAKSAAVGFFVKTGSRDETKQLSGVSHFLEHMLFKGTDKLGTLEVNEAFDRLGAQYNASTGEENTIYYAAVLPEYLPDVMQLWAELMRPALRDDDFNMEKNVIKEEIAMYEDTPSFEVIDKGRSLHFESHPCGNSVLGTRESIDALAVKQMHDYFTSRYPPNNMTIALAGNFDWNRMSEITARHCDTWPRRDGVQRQTTDYTGSFKTERMEKKNLNREHVCLVSPAVPMQDARRFAAHLLAEIIGDSVGSRYFWALVDKALAETATMQCEPMDGTGAFYSYIQCSSENLHKVFETLKTIFDDLEANGITQAELAAARNKTLSTMVLKNELPMGRLVSLGFDWVYLGQYRSVEQDVADVKAVTVDDVNSLIRQLNPGRFTKFTLGPAHTH